MTSPITAPRPKTALPYHTNLPTAQQFSGRWEENNFFSEQGNYHSRLYCPRVISSFKEEWDAPNKKLTEVDAKSFMGICMENRL